MTITMPIASPARKPGITARPSTSRPAARVVREPAGFIALVSTHVDGLGHGGCREPAGRWRSRPRRARGGTDMTDVLAGITTSLDGYVAGPDDGPDKGLGQGGERLHYWVFGGPWTYAGEHDGEPTGADKEFLDDMMHRVGAVIGGRGTFDAADRWVGRTHGPSRCSSSRTTRTTCRMMPASYSSTAWTRPSARPVSRPAARTSTSWVAPTSSDRRSPAATSTSCRSRSRRSCSVAGSACSTVSTDRSSSSTCERSSPVRDAHHVSGAALGTRAPNADDVDDREHEEDHRAASAG